jgi:7,8-dihydropterin-6-yl-methyl-4-(beta-D-ribofuranosyl)aminobenzene 5'-phosphate synthase
MSDYLHITTLVEDTVSGTELSCEHGLSLWIEYGDWKVLFDTGQSSLLLENAEKLHVDIGKTAAVILSHGHYDHTGGLAAVLDAAPGALVYAHPAALEAKFSCKSAQARAIGMPDPVNGVVRSRAEKNRVLWTEEPVEVMPGFFVTGPIPRKTDFEDVGGAFYVDENCDRADTLPDDQAAFFDTHRGLIVISGCSHAGIVNTMNYIMKLSGNKHIYSVVGGMHLLNASQDRIEKTVKFLRECNVQNIAPCHCTGANAARQICDAVPGQCVECSTGGRLQL